MMKRPSVVAVVIFVFIFIQAYMLKKISFDTCSICISILVGVLLIIANIPNGRE